MNIEDAMFGGNGATYCCHHMAAKFLKSQVQLNRRINRNL